MQQIQSKQKLSCYHCGETCSNQTLHIEEKYFCCCGCKMVYELLNKNNLCSYYDLTQNPGISQKLQVRADKFSYLEDTQVKEKLIRYSDEKQSHISFYLPQMHCSSCIWLLENLAQLNRGIISSVVNFPKKEIAVVYNHTQISLREVAELLTSIGYEPHINLSDLDEKKVKPINRSRMFKLGVAGFCFGNIMMLSFPEYFSDDLTIDSSLRNFFSYLNLLLSLPVLTFSASEFYISAWKGLKQKILNIDAPIVVAIIITFSRSAFEIISSTGPGYLDSMSGIVFFMIAGRMFQDRVHHSISFERDYKSYFPIAVTVKKDTQEQNIPVSKLKVGDRIIVRNQEIIPADSILFLGKANIDYSFVTGESIPQEKGIGEILYAGGKQVGAALELEVVKEVSQSYLTQLWNNDVFHKSQNKSTSFIHQLSRYFTLLLFSFAALVSFYWWVYDSSKILTALTSILIVACPCSLLLSATFTNGNIIRIFYRNKFYVKNSETIETLAACDSIVFDKTGTITDNHSIELSFEGEALNPHEKQLISSLVSQSTHPLSKPVFKSLGKQQQLICHSFKEHVGQGISADIGGEQLRLGSENFILQKKSAAQNSSKIYIELNGKMRGVFVLKIAYRKGLKNLMQELKKAYSLTLLSGDNDAEQNNLKKLFGATSPLCFNQSPEDKLNYISQIQAGGRKVIMIGDGLNDAGALKSSDVGIVISENTNNFSPACDALLEASEFTNLKCLLDYAKTGKAIIIGSFILSILYNLVGLSFAAQGTLSPLIAAILMPASSLSILVFTVGLSSLLAKRRGLL